MRPLKICLAAAALCAPVLLASCGGDSQTSTTVSRQAAAKVPACFPKCDRAKLAGANLAGLDLSGGSFYEANMPEADLIGTNLTNANLRYANLSAARLLRANLTGAKLFSANLMNAEWGETTCPDGVVRDGGC
jgi:hypothetical protein